MASATFWTIMLVALNTPEAVVSVRPLPESPAFQTKQSCEEHISHKKLAGAVCFTGGALLTLGSIAKNSETAQANIWIEGSPWITPDREGGL